MTLPKKVWVNVGKIMLENTGIDRADRGCRKNGRAASLFKLNKHATPIKYVA
jgi:hypothetical protein